MLTNSLPANSLTVNSLPAATDSIRLNDLPALLGPYAITAPVYVYQASCGTIKATRCRLRDDEDLILILSPRGRVPQLPA